MAERFRLIYDRMNSAEGREKLKAQLAQRKHPQTGQPLSEAEQTGEITAQLQLLNMLAKKLTKDDETALFVNTPENQLENKLKQLNTSKSLGLSDQTISGLAQQIKQMRQQQSQQPPKPPEQFHGLLSPLNKIFAEYKLQPKQAGDQPTAEEKFEEARDRLYIDGITKEFIAAFLDETNIDPDKIEDAKEKFLATREKINKAAAKAAFPGYLAPIAKIWPDDVAIIPLDPKTGQPNAEVRAAIQKLYDENFPKEKLLTFLTDHTSCPEDQKERLSDEIFEAAQSIHDTVFTDVLRGKLQPLITVLKNKGVVIALDEKTSRPTGAKKAMRQLCEEGATDENITLFCAETNKPIENDVKGAIKERFRLIYLIYFQDMEEIVDYLIDKKVYLKLQPDGSLSHGALLALRRLINQGFQDDTGTQNFLKQYTTAVDTEESLATLAKELKDKQSDYLSRQAANLTQQTAPSWTDFVAEVHALTKDQATIETIQEKLAPLQEAVKLVPGLEALRKRIETLFTDTPQEGILHDVNEEKRTTDLTQLGTLHITEESNFDAIDSLNKLLNQIPTPKSKDFQTFLASLQRIELAIRYASAPNEADLTFAIESSETNTERLQLFKDALRELTTNNGERLRHLRVTPPALLEKLKNLRHAVAKVLGVRKQDFAGKYASLQQILPEEKHPQLYTCLWQLADKQLVLKDNPAAVFKFVRILEDNKEELRQLINDQLNTDKDLKELRICIDGLLCDEENDPKHKELLTFWQSITAFQSLCEHMPTHVCLDTQVVTAESYTALQTESNQLDAVLTDTNTGIPDEIEEIGDLQRALNLIVNKTASVPGTDGTTIDVPEILEERFASIIFSSENEKAKFRALLQTAQQIKDIPALLQALRAVMPAQGKFPDVRDQVNFNDIEAFQIGGGVQQAIELLTQEGNSETHDGEGSIHQKQRELTTLLAAVAPGMTLDQLQTHLQDGIPYEQYKTYPLGILHAEVTYIFQQATFGTPPETFALPEILTIRYQALRDKIANLSTTPPLDALDEIRAESDTLQKQLFSLYQLRAVLQEFYKLPDAQDENASSMHNFLKLYIQHLINRATITPITQDEYEKALKLIRYLKNNNLVAFQAEMPDPSTLQYPAETALQRVKDLQLEQIDADLARFNDSLKTEESLSITQLAAQKDLLCQLVLYHRELSEALQILYDTADSENTEIRDKVAQKRQAIEQAYNHYQRRQRRKGLPITTIKCIIYHPPTDQGTWRIGATKDGIELKTLYGKPCAIEEFHSIDSKDKGGKIIFRYAHPGKTEGRQMKGFIEMFGGSDAEKIEQLPAILASYLLNRPPKPGETIPIDGPKKVVQEAYRMLLAYGIPEEMIEIRSSYKPSRFRRKNKKTLARIGLLKKILAEGASVLSKDALRELPGYQRPSEPVVPPKSLGVEPDELKPVEEEEEELAAPNDDAPTYITASEGDIADLSDFDDDDNQPPPSAQLTIPDAEESKEPPHTPPPPAASLLGEEDTDTEKDKDLTPSTSDDDEETVHLLPPEKKVDKEETTGEQQQGILRRTWHGVRHPLAWWSGAQPEEKPLLTESTESDADDEDTPKEQPKPEEKQKADDKDQPPSPGPDATK